MDNDTNGNRRMTKAEALGVLARMATSRGLSLEEVIAIQVAFRATAKRMFDRERSFKRRREAAMAMAETVARQEGAE